MPFLYTIIILAGIYLCSPVSADNARRIASGNYLEYSLMGLKESAKSTRDQNRLLARQINQIKKDTETLRQKLGEVSQNKQQLAVGYENVRSHAGNHVEQLELVKQQFLRFQKDAEEVSQEELRMRELFEGKIKQDHVYQEKIASLEKEIVEIGERMQELEYIVNDDHDQQIRNYKQSIRDSDRKVKMAQKDLRQLEKEHGKPARNFGDLERENDGLRQELQKLIDEQARLSPYGDSAPLEAATEISTRPEVFAKDITKLRERKRELGAILGKAKSKMDKVAVAGESGFRIADLENNLLVIEQENLALRDQYNALAQRLDLSSKE